VDEQPLLSVTVTVYSPCVNPLAVCPVPPEGDQLYVYGEIPLVTLATADPVLPPKQLTPVPIVVTLTTGLTTTVAVVVAVLGVASVIVSV